MKLLRTNSYIYVLRSYKKGTALPSFLRVHEELCSLVNTSSAQKRQFFTVHGCDSSQPR
jgi:hypothetical protein